MPQVVFFLYNLGTPWKTVWQNSELIEIIPEIFRIKFYNSIGVVILLSGSTIQTFTFIMTFFLKFQEIL